MALLLLLSEWLREYQLNRTTINIPEIVLFANRFFTAPGNRVYARLLAYIPYSLMVSLEGSPSSLLVVWHLYVEHIQQQFPKEKAYGKLAQAKTAIIRYTLPQWGLPLPQGNKLTDWEVEQAFEFMAHISLQQLQSALVVQNQLFEEQQAPAKIRQTYRSALNQLLKWCQEQGWFGDTDATEQPLLKPPKKSRNSDHDTRRSSDSKNNDQNDSIPYRYALGSVEGDVINPSLQQELQEFKAFRLQPDFPGFKAVSSSTVERELANIRQLLGWLHRVEGKQSETLRLNSIIPYINNASDEQAKEVARDALSLAYQYMAWRKGRQDGIEKFLNDYSDTLVFKTFLVIARYLYRQEIASTIQAQSTKKDIPVIAALKGGLKLWTQKRPTKAPNDLKQEEKQLQPEITDPEITDWAEILSIVEQLRAECRARLLLQNQTRKNTVSLGPPRSLPAIAQDYQRFLLFALMSYLPPDRQQTYRNLLAIDDFPIHAEDVSGACYRQGDYWYLHLVSTKTRPEHLIKIPNIQYSEGRCFYQYLQEWLSDYAYEVKTGQWQRINGLRLALSPQHQYFFTKKNGSKYSFSTELSQIIRDTAHRISGKLLRPHGFRKLFVTKLKQFPVENPPPLFKELINYLSDEHLGIYETRHPEILEAAVWAAGEMAQAATL